MKSLFTWLHKFIIKFISIIDLYLKSLLNSSIGKKADQYIVICDSLWHNKNNGIMEMNSIINCYPVSLNVFLLLKKPQNSGIEWLVVGWVGGGGGYSETG